MRESDVWVTPLGENQNHMAGVGLYRYGEASLMIGRLQRAYARVMRVIVSHNRPKEEIMRSVDRSFDDLFKGPGFMSIQIVNQHRRWTGSKLTFSFDAKAGFISTPIKGFVDVTDKDVTVEADLGLLEKLIPAKKAQEAITDRVRGLLT
jgi:hypothetical protein